MEIDQTDQLGDDGDMVDEDDADESDEERTADPNFLVPTYKNEPVPNDIFALKWGKDHYFKYLPRLKGCHARKDIKHLHHKLCMHACGFISLQGRTCPFEREFIRIVVKEMEVSVTFIVCYFYTSTFHILSLQ